MSLQFRLSLTLLAFAALLFGGCSLRQTKGDPNNPSSSASSSSKGKAVPGVSFTPSSDARKDVRDALNRLKTAYPYRMTETMSATANGQMAMPESTRVVEFAAPDRSHMKWTGGQGEDVEAISIGDKHYWFSNGKWTEGGVPMSEKANRGADFANKLAEMVKEVKYVGPETINGISCHAYTGTYETTMAGQKYSGNAKVWIGANDGLIHQSDSDFTVSNYGGKSHIVYEYNVNIKVEPPVM